MDNRADYITPARHIMYLFIAFTAISYVYTLITGTYNGDFRGIETQLTQAELFYCFVLTIAPFIVLFFIYKRFQHAQDRRRIIVNLNSPLLGLFLLIVVVFQIVTAYCYGAGVLAQDTYKAPPLITVFIKIFSRFNILFGVFIYMGASTRRDWSHVLLLALCCVLTILRTSLMGLVEMALFLYIFYYDSIIHLIKRDILLVVICAVVAPFCIGYLYDMRDSLRNKVEVLNARDMNTQDLIFGKFCGRLSSFPSTAIILERKDGLKQILEKHHLNEYQYTKEAISVFYGQLFEKDDFKYMYTLTESQGISTKVWTLMNGTQGSLMLSSYISSKAFWITLLTMCLIVLLTYELGNMFTTKGVLEAIYVFFCIAGLSGVALEYSGILMTLLLYITLSVIIEFFNRIKSSYKQ